MKKDDPIEELRIGIRAYNCLKLAGISTLEELEEALRYSRLFYACGRKTWTELELAIIEYKTLDSREPHK